MSDPALDTRVRLFPATRHDWWWGTVNETNTTETYTLDGDGRPATSVIVVTNPPNYGLPPTETLTGGANVPSPRPARTRTFPS